MSATLTDEIVSYMEEEWGLPTTHTSFGAFETIALVIDSVYEDEIPPDFIKAMNEAKRGDLKDFDF